MYIKVLMKKIILYLLTLTYFSIFSAAAECNFTINIGEKINKKFIEKFTEPMEMYNGQFMLPVPSPEVCPNDNLGMDIAVEYLFLGDLKNMKLAAIRMLALNDDKNTTSNKLTLMNYAKKIYGDFDTGFNPKAYNDFEIWEEGQSIVLYKRFTNADQIIEEEIYISNKEFDQKLGNFFNQIEMNQLKKDFN
jgi:hypothetical protein